jgi:hypothetical protein
MKSKRIILAIITGLLMSLAAFGQEIQPEASPSPDPTPTPEVTAVVTGLEPKQEGIIRIGVVTIKTKFQQETASQDMAEVIRTRWYSYLDGPTIELIPMEARIPLQINIEANKKECDYVLYSTVSQKTKGSFFGKFVKVAVPVLTSSIPVGVGGTTGNSIFQSIKQSVKEGAKEAAKNMANEAATKIKAKDQVTLDFSLVKVNASAPAMAKSLKVKAAADGEDIISPLIEQAAGQILEVAMKAGSEPPA